MLLGLTLLVAFLLAGEGLAHGLELPVPGSVLGMLMLFIALRLWPGRWLEHSSRPAAEGLIRFLPLLFLPAGAGIFFLPPALLAQWPAVLAAITIATFISMIVTGGLIRWLAGKRHD